MDESVCYRFNALRELIPHKDKMDKATFLQQAVDYIRQLQVMLSDCLLACYDACVKLMNHMCDNALPSFPSQRITCFPELAVHSYHQIMQPR